MKPNALLFTLLALTLLSCTNKTEEKQDPVITEKPADENSTYEALRNQALTIAPEQLGLTLSKDSLVVYGVIMDWGIDEQTVTMTAYKTGDASLYISSGGGVLGGGQYENVSKASKKLIALAQDFATGSPVEKTPLPIKDKIFFYLLTNKGIYLKYEEMSKIEGNSSPILPLFNEANLVLGELRSVSEN